MGIDAFSAGLSGLNASSAYLSVIGNNLANINTVGFKASSVTFKDLVSQNIASTSANPTQVGLGVITGSVTPVFSQGPIENTRESTNAAIQGGGFFIVRGNDGGTSYTRAGDFSFNREGKLASSDGFFVQGYMTLDPLTGDVVTSGAPGDITIDQGALRRPVATTQFQTQTNLDARAAAADTYTTSVQVHDSLGAPHIATITFTKQAAAGTWNYTITAPGEDVAGGVAGTPYQLKAGSVVFNANGTLTTVDGAAAADVAIATPAWANGAAVSNWVWNVMDATDPTLTGFAASSTTSSQTQNGSAPGTVSNISISSDGTILATVGVGQTMAIGQLALASFNNPKGLLKMGGSRYSQNEEAGIPSIGVAGTGGRGTLMGSALEQSNVDIAQEFTRMILAQRGYQANSKTITVSDELMQDTLALKR